MKKTKTEGRGIAGAVVGSIVAHAALAVIAGVWVVAHYIRNEPPQFVAPPAPKIKIPPQTRQHRMNLAAHAGLASKPVFKQRLVSLRPTSFALPEAPKISMTDLLAPDPSAMATSVVTGLAGAGGIGAGSGFGLGGAGGKGIGSGIQFLGVQANGRKVLLLFDVSRSVVNKAAQSSMPLVKIKEETLTMIDQLPADARFGMIQFVRNYKPFASSLIAATKPNRDLARQWVETEWNESGQMARSGKSVISPSPNGLPPILRAAFQMDPDVIFIISDGSFERGVETSEKISSQEFDALLAELQGARAMKVPVHFIGFQMRPVDKECWEKIARRYGGSLKELK
jgi:hypothetical protein